MEGHDHGPELVLHQQGDGERRPGPPGPGDPGRDPGRDQRAQRGAGSPAHGRMGERYLKRDAGGRSAHASHYGCRLKTLI